MSLAQLHPTNIDSASSLAATGPIDGAARLRQNCRMILDWLDTSGGDVDGVPGLTNQLTTALGATAAAVADTLEREAAHYDDAIHNLRTLLQARFLSPPPSVANLIDDLTARRQAVGTALTMVRAMAAPTPACIEDRYTPADSWKIPVTTSNRLSQRERSGEPEPEAEARATASIATPPPSLPLRAPATFTDHIRPNRPVEAAAHPPAPLDQEPDTDLAVELYRSAESLQRDGEFSQAAATYSLALQADPNFAPARSRRGQIRLALGDTDAAIADFTVTLDLDDTAVEAWWWRGDAHAVAGRMDAAIIDYERALALKPDLTRARFNLAVALRRHGEIRRALVEFARVLKERPGHAAAHLNRGLIHLHLGERTRAETEFRAALAHDPDCEQARQQLDALAPPVVKATPPAEAKRGVGQLAVDCPRCGHTGEVSLDRLNKVFVCVKCECRFGVRTDGGVVELAADRDGKWVEAPKLRATKRVRRKRRLAVAAFVLVFIALPIVGFTGWRTLRATPAATEAELPRELNARAELFGRAWAANDMRTMRRLTSPADEKAVYPWSLRHAPPATIRPKAAEAHIEVSAKPAKPGVSTVQLRVSPPGTPPADLTLTWQQRGDTWYFVPTR